MAFVPPRVFPLTDRQAAGGLSHARQSQELFRAGLRWVQIREKELPDRSLLADLDQAVRFGRDSGGMVVVNDRPDLALLSGAGGVHLGADDLPVPQARVVLGPAAVIGSSSHDAASARAAEADGADYVAFGPIYPTASKADARQPAGLEALRRVRDAVQIPLVAIGGITLERAASVLAAGADSVAVIQDLIGAPVLGERARLWQEKLGATPEVRRGLVFLTGFMGSGKTTVGAELARRRGCRFVDLDTEIEKRRGKRVVEIFASEGEAAFRAVEAEALGMIPRGADAVVALGGGTLLSTENLAQTKLLGPLVWLDVRLEDSLARCANQAQRPLLAAGATAEGVAALHAARLPGYRSADWRMADTGLGVGEQAQAILDWFASRPGGGARGMC